MGRGGVSVRSVVAGRWWLGESCEEQVENRDEEVGHDEEVDRKRRKRG